LWVRSSAAVVTEDLMFSSVPSDKFQAMTAFFQILSFSLFSTQLTFRTICSEILTAP
jgi:hypothetical protein